MFENGVFEQGESDIRYDKADYLRQKYGLNLKAGILVASTRRIGLDVYTGIGLRIRNNQYSNLVNPREEEGDFREMDLSSYLLEEGSSLGFNLAVGLKLNFNF